MKKRNDLHVLLYFFVILIFLFILDITPMKKYFGFEVVQKYLKEDYNIFKIGKGFFGDDINFLYNQEADVVNNVIEEIDYGEYQMIVVSNEELSSEWIGVVKKIIYENGYYSIEIDTESGSITLAHLITCEVKLYDKIDSNIIIGKLANCEVGYYYLYQKN